MVVSEIDIDVDIDNDNAESMLQLEGPVLKPTGKLR